MSDSGKAPYKFEPISGRQLPLVQLIEPLAKIEDLIRRTCEYLFKGNLSMANPPLKGFLLEGVPGTGKTEIVKQVTRNLDRRLRTVFHVLIDGGDIASPRWGDAEWKLTSVFRIIDQLKEEKSDPKVVVLFDDIESLMMARGASIAREWHYSINSILFHEIDRLDPSKIIICATTNRPDLVDEAIRTRLYPIQVNPVGTEFLMKIVDEILISSKTSDEARIAAREEIETRLTQMEAPTIRDARQITVIVCMEKGVWSV